MTKLLFAFCGRVSTEDTRNLKHRGPGRSPRHDASCRPVPRSSRSISTSGRAALCRGRAARRPPGCWRTCGPARTVGTPSWSGSSPGRSARRSSTRPSTHCSSTSASICGCPRSADGSISTRPRPKCCSACSGGTSKQERALIRSRVRDGMTVLAQDGKRHLGGTPPYGYLLADAGEHPNPKKRALGQRLRRLEPDPVTAPVVERIFSMFAAGHGLKQIATTLTLESVPSPSAHDRERNPHRDPRGWAHTAIRAILHNEKYLGRAVWGKQARVEEFYDLDDVAAGYTTLQRWTDNERWVYGPEDAHPALVSRELWDAVHARIVARRAQGSTAPRSPRTTNVPYMLRCLLHCVICERKMVGTVAHNTRRYHCLATQTRALPAYLSGHPKAVYVREDVIVRAIGHWLPTLADSDWLSTCNQPEPTQDARRNRLAARLNEIDAATANLVRAIETGTDPEVVQQRIAQLRAERQLTVHELSKVPADDLLTSADIDAIVNELGGLAAILEEAEPLDKMRVYQALDLRLQYQPDQAMVVASADLGRVVSRVGGPSPSLRTRSRIDFGRACAGDMRPHASTFAVIGSDEADPRPMPRRALRRRPDTTAGPRRAGERDRRTRHGGVHILRVRGAL